jgi:hypothetical protein
MNFLNFNGFGELNICLLDYFTFDQNPARQAVLNTLHTETEKLRQRCVTHCAILGHAFVVV